MGQVVPTVEGQSLTITAVGGIVQIISHAGSVAQVSTADVLASNGAVHIINSVLFPGPALAAKPNKTIVELAQATPDLSTLVAAVVAGNLTDTLSGAGPFTVFAPTNDAFAALPNEITSNLTMPSQGSRATPKEAKCIFRTR